MNTKHTPGPWKVDNVFNVRAKDGTFICNTILDSDAALIAASPSMLSALKEIVSNCGNTTIDPLEVLKRNYRIAIKAITEAEGGRP